MRLMLVLVTACLAILPAASAGKAPVHLFAVSFNVGSVDEFGAVVDVDTGKVTRLERDRVRGCQDTAPGTSWSPDGRRFVYATCAGLRVSLGDSYRTVLIRNGPRSAWPAGWSPDGRWIAFYLGADPDDEEPVDDPESAVAEVENDGSTGVWVMRPDGTGRRHVAPGWPSAVWMRDSKHLVVDYNANDSRCNRAGLYVYDLDGRARRLPNGGDGRHPAVSPDGRLVAFAKGPEGDSAIVVERLDGSGFRTVTESTDDTFDIWPTWDPSSRRLAFVRGIKPPPAPPPEPDPESCDRSHDTDFFTTCPPVEPPDTDPVATSIWTVELAGGHARALTGSNAMFEDSASWSPDGRLLAFSRQRREDIGENTKAVVRNLATGRERVVARPIVYVDGWRPA